MTTQSLVNITGMILEKYKNPIPVGWAVVFLLMLVWAVWYYLIGYPLNSYSQIGEYNKEVKEANAKFEKSTQTLAKRHFMLWVRAYI